MHVGELPAALGRIDGIQVWDWAVVEARSAEKEIAQTAADLLGESLSEFYRRAARAEAERVLAERQRIVVDLEVAERVLAALDRPGERNDRLARLWEQPSLLGT